MIFKSFDPKTFINTFDSKINELYEQKRLLDNKPKKDSVKRSSSIYKPSTSSKNVTINSLINNISNHKIYEQKLKSFLEDIKANKIQYNLLKILFEYEDNFKLVCDIYQKFIKSKL